MAVTGSGGRIRTPFPAPVPDPEPAPELATYFQEAVLGIFDGRYYSLSLHVLRSTP